MTISSLNPLGYLGLKEKNPPNIKISNREPTTGDFGGYFLGDFWLDTSGATIWVLLSKEAGIATWHNFSQTPNLNYEEVTSATKTIESDYAYGANRGGGVAFTLPTSSEVGDMFEICGILGNWSLAQNVTQYIQIGDSKTTIGVGGSITATQVGDCIRCRCISANTGWIVTSMQGNLTFV